jgi:hypothetical protein
MTGARRTNFVAYAPSNYLMRHPNYLEEHHKAIQRAEQEREKAHQRDLQAQVSPQNEPRVRVITRERLHALALPRSPEHPLVRLIARQTGLTLREVLDEQEGRAGLGSG